MNAHREISIESFKRSDYDRGSKKVIVDGEQWGWIEMVSGGMHGPSYHLHDMHGKITRLDDGDSEVAMTIRPNKINGRHAAWDLRCKGQKVPTTDSILLDWARQAVADNHLRAPAERDQEIADATEALRRRHEAADRREQQKLDKRAQDIIFMIADGKPNDDIKTAIVAAMKWAQTL